MVSPNYRREAELIVQEENEAKSKMPTYKGLEKYKLLEKMGECVHLDISSSLSVAFADIPEVAPFQTCIRHWT